MLATRYSSWSTISTLASYGIVRTPVNESAENIVISNLTIDGNRANNIEHQAGIHHRRQGQ